MNRFAPLLLLLAAPAFGQNPAPTPPVPEKIIAKAYIDAPASVPAGGRLVLLGDKAVYRSIKYKAIKPKDATFVVQGGSLIVRDPVPGITYSFLQQVKGDDDTDDIDIAEVSILPSTPAPKPVDPVPTPVPVTPTPTVDPTPSDQTTGVIGNMRVLALYESSANLNTAQAVAWYSPTIRAYLNAKCIKALNGAADWRYLDKDTDMTNATPEARDAFAKAKADATPLPKFVVFSGTTLVGSRTIATEADALAFLQSKGGK